MSTNRCEWCSRPAPEGETRCEACGGPVHVIEPWVIECGWCFSSNRRDETAVCRSCGGPLPGIPGGHPGPRPPDAPRSIPARYRRRTLLWKNTFALVGAFFTVIMFWSLVFPLIGIPMWIYGHRKAKRWLEALERGTATRGRLQSVEKDLSQTINGRHPWKLAFEFDTPDGLRQGTIEAWDPVHGKRPPGEHLWVVYQPERQDHYALWPPLR